MVQEPDTLTGTTIAGRYVVERPLAMGGMGAVYVAVQNPLGRDVALKVLRPSLLADPVAVERFKNEARIVAQLGHPHIVSIYEFGTTEDGILFIAMELLEGKSLGTLLRNTGPLPWERTLPIVCGIARALGAAHQKGVVHRDLKPDNVLLVDVPGMGDFVKVLDFGIAKLVRSEEHAQNLTGTGFVPGTPGYIAPEEITGDSKNDPRADLYALGVTWFEMLTGKRPFDGDSAMKVFLAHLQEPVPKLAAKAPGLAVPESVEALLSSLLAKDPAQRPASAEAFLAAIDHLGLVVPPTPAASPIAGTPTSLSPALATMTSLSTPGTQVRAFAPAGTPQTGSSPAAPQVASPTTTGPATDPALVEKLLAEKRFWIRVWRIILAFVVVIIAGLAVTAGWLFIEGKRTHILLRGGLPLIENSSSPVGLELQNAVQAYLRGDEAAAREGVDRVRALSPDEPGADLLQGLLVDDPENVDTRVALFAQAKTDLAKLVLTYSHDGRRLVELVAGAYERKPEDLPGLLAACDECRESPLAAIGVADALAIARRTDLAVQVLDAAAARNHSVAMIYVRKARILLEAGRAHDALVAAEEGKAHSPASPALLRALGNAHLAVGEMHEGIDDLKKAVEGNAGLPAQLDLAHAYILADDEAGRRVTIDGLLHNATAAERCRIAADHGLALIGAGRGADARALFFGCFDGAASAPREALRASIRAFEAFDALDDPKLWLSVNARTATVVTPGSFPFSEALDDVAHAVLELCNNNLDKADAALAAMEKLPDASWPWGSRRALVAYVATRIRMREGRYDEALAAAKDVSLACRQRARYAEIYVAASRTADAEDALGKLLEQASYCRTMSFQGAYILQALVQRAELHARQDPVKAASELKKGLDEMFPRADPDGEIMQRARALMAPLAK